MPEYGNAYEEPEGDAGVNVNDEFDPIYCIPKTKTRIVKTLKDKLAEAGVDFSANGVANDAQNPSTAASRGAQ